METIHVFIAYHFAKNQVEIPSSLLDKVINWVSHQRYSLIIF